MYDLIIRGGTIVDGSGNARYTGDIAIQDACCVKTLSRISQETENY